MASFGVDCGICSILFIILFWTVDTFSISFLVADRGLSKINFHLYFFSNLTIPSS
jgi:hypothetical protein